MKLTCTMARVALTTFKKTTRKKQLIFMWNPVKNENVLNKKHEAGRYKRNLV